MRIIVSLTAALAVSGSVYAQDNPIVKYSGGTTLGIQSCTRTNPQRVVCTGNILNNEDDREPYFDEDYFILISPTGDETKLSGITIKGNNAYKRSTQLRKGISYPVQLTFEGYTANNIKYFDSRYATSESRRFENVPLLSSVPRPATPTPASATSGAAVNLGPGQVVLNGKAYTVTLTGCKLNTAGAYSCTGAISTPLR